MPLLKVEKVVDDMAVVRRLGFVFLLGVLYQPPLFVLGSFMFRAHLRRGLRKLSFKVVMALCYVFLLF